MYKDQLYCLRDDYETSNNYPVKITFGLNLPRICHKYNDIDDNDDVGFRVRIRVTFIYIWIEERN